jgi:hypothetical protein
MVGKRIFVGPDRRVRFDAETGLHYNYFSKHAWSKLGEDFLKRP